MPDEPTTPAEDLPQDPATPGGTPKREPDREDDSLETPEAPVDPPGIDAPGSPSPPPSEYGPKP
jgi:hypothetical protein